MEPLQIVVEHESTEIQQETGDVPDTMFTNAGFLESTQAGDSTGSRTTLTEGSMGGSGLLMGGAVVDGSFQLSRILMSPSISPIPRRLHMISYAIELLQLFSLISCCLPAGPLVNWTYWASSLRGDFQGHDPPSFAPTVLVLLGGWMFLAWVLFLGLGWWLGRGGVIWNGGSVLGLLVRVVGISIALFPPFAWPIGGLTISLILPASGSESGLFYLIFGIIILVLVSFLTIYDSIFHKCFLPFHSVFAVGHSRSHLVIALAKVFAFCVNCISLFFSESFELYFHLHWPLIGLALFTTFITFPPFIVRYINCLYSTVFGMVLWAGVIDVICWTFNVSSSIKLIIFASGALPSFICGWLLTIQRLRSFSACLKSPENAANKEFKFPFQVEMTLRKVYNMVQSNISPEFRNSIFSMLDNAEKTFPHSAWVHLMIGLYKLTVLHQPDGLVLAAKTALRQSPSLDIRFATMSLMEHAKRLSVQGSQSSVGPELEQQLASATRHERLISLYSVRFWQNLLRIQAVGESVTSNLLKIVRDIESHDRQAGNILQHLVRRYPTTPIVLRRFAVYTEFHRNDIVTADELHNLADLCEQTKKKQQSTVGLAWMPTDEKGQGEQQEEQGRREGERKREGGAQSRHFVDFSVEGGEPPMDTISQFEDAYSDSDGLSIKSSASTMRSIDSGRLQFLRARSERSGVMSSRRVNRSILLLWFVVLIGAVCSFFILTSALDSYQTHMMLMNHTVCAGRAANGALFYLRNLEEDLLHGKGIHSHETEYHIHMTLLEAHEFQEYFTEMFQSSSLSESISEFWTEQTLPMRLYVRGEDDSFSNGTFYTKDMHVFNAGYTFVNFLKDILGGWLNDSSTVFHARTDPRFRFLLDNCASTLTPSLYELCTLYANGIHGDCSTIILTAIVILAIDAGILVLTFISMFLFSLWKLKKERTAVISLLTELPKSAVVNLIDKLQESSSSSSHVLDRKKIDTILLVCFSVVFGLVIVFSISVMVGVFCINFATQSQGNGHEIQKVGMRTNYAILMMFYAQELTIDDHSSWNSDELVHFLDSILAQTDQLDSELTFGDSDYFEKSSELEYLWFEKPCPPEFGFVHCQGLAGLWRRFIDAISDFYKSPHEIQSTNHTSYHIAMRIFDIIVDWQIHDKNYLEDAYISVEQQAVLFLDIYLGFLIPLVLSLYVVNRFQVQRLRLEVSRVFKMLLSVPLNVLDNVPAIREYLEGETSVQDSQKLSGKLQDQHTKSILAASGDSVIVTDEKFSITIFNSAAETMLGYPASEVLGQGVEVIFQNNPEALKSIRHKSTDLVHLQTTVARNDGASFPGWLSISKSSVMGRLTTAVFIRDMTEIKKHERLVERERRKAQALLLNILPKEIATELQLPSQLRGEVIAHEYKSVTVLFADIVNFTPKSSQLSGSILVLMLHRLFGMMDKLCLTHGVEKVKTIGDCYMACCGAPHEFTDHAEVMVDFAIAMMDSLKEFNSLPNKPWETELDIRIGINSGPVVAGVIGSHKFQYDIWGDCVNLASRMESTSLPGHIQISESTYALVSDKGYEFETVDAIEVKGKGTMKCYRWLETQPENRKSPLFGPAGQSGISPTLSFDQLSQAESFCLESSRSSPTLSRRGHHTPLLTLHEEEYEHSPR